jgi:hypothetical protein
MNGLALSESSWLLIGLQSVKMSETVPGLAVETLSPAYLAGETLASPALLLSAAAMGLGYVMVARGRRGALPRRETRAALALTRFMQGC